MSTIRNWPTRAMYMLLALALVLGMAIVPTIPTTAQEIGPEYPTIDPPSIAYNVKGATHKVCIDLNDWQSSFNTSYVTIDWWLESGVALSPADITVIEPVGDGPSGPYQETIKTRGTMDNVPCIEIRSMKRGDIHIFAEVTFWSGPWIPGQTPPSVVDQLTLHTEKKWGEIYRSDLDVDLKKDGVQHEMATIEIPAGASGTYKQWVEDTIRATFLEVPVPVLVDGAVVHWWLVQDKPEYKADIRELMRYLEEHDGYYFNDYSAAGKYVSDPDDLLGGKEPWQFINDWVRDPADEKYADPDVFSWGALDPAGTIDTVPGTGDWYAWNHSVDGKARAQIWVDESKMEPCKTYEIMIVVLVSYPSGSTDQDDPFNGENRVAVQIGQKSYHKGRTPVTAQVKTPQLRWASEKLVLEKDWGVYPYFEFGYYWYDPTTEEEYTQVCPGPYGCEPERPDDDQRWVLIGEYFDARIYLAIYNLELGSIGNLEPINNMREFYVGMPDLEYYEISLDSIGLPAGAQQVIAPLGGGYYSWWEEEEEDERMWGDSVSRAIVSTEQSGQVDVNAGLWEIGLHFVDMDYGESWLDIEHMWFEGPISNHGFLAYFLAFEDVTLSDVTPQMSLQDLEPREDDAHVAVQVRGYFDHNNSNLPPTTREAKVIYIDGDPDLPAILPAGRYVFPDDWVLLAGTKNVKLRPNWDLMDRAHHDSIVSEPDANWDTLESHGDYNTGVRTTDPPAVAEWPTVGPFSTLQLWSAEGMWVTEASVPSSLGIDRNTVVPDGIIDRWDAPMPPALVIFDIVDETEDASLSQLLKTDLYGYGYMLDGLGNKIYQSPYYAVEIPASPYIPPGYPGWQSWTAYGIGPIDWLPIDGPYFFWTDLELATRWAYENPIDHKDVEVYSDNHGIAAVSIDALRNLGYVTITATADYPYTPKMGKYGPRVSDEITASWGEPPPLIVNPHFWADKIEVEVGETVTFTNDTAGGTPPYLAAAWDFDGDGITDSTAAVQTGETVTWEYDAPGLYNVSLTIVDIDETRTEVRWYYITVLGEPVEPTPDEPGLGDGLASIASELVIVYYYAGAGVWEAYWPAFSIDTIGTLEVGKIYMIYVDANCTLQYGTKSYALTGPDWNFVYWQAQ